VLASGEVGVDGVAVDDTNVYWTIRTSSGSIRMMPKLGGTPVTLAPDQANPTAYSAQPGHSFRRLGHPFRRTRAGSELSAATTGGGQVRDAQAQR
jgi:hypothetical protein